MPADIVGSMIMETDDRGDKVAALPAGPIFANLVLADEINRATPKTQSALLEAMQERTVTSGTTTHELEAPFLVMATQNPIEMEGTYPLPEAQLDRFLMKILVTYPTRDELNRIVERTISAKRSRRSAVLDREAIMEVRARLPRGAGGAARPGIRHRTGDGHAARSAGGARAGQASTSATAVRRAARRRWWSAGACCALMRGRFHLAWKMFCTWRRRAAPSHHPELRRSCRRADARNHPPVRV